MNENRDGDTDMRLLVASAIFGVLHCCRGYLISALVVPFRDFIRHVGWVSYAVNVFLFCVGTGWREFAGRSCGTGLEDHIRPARPSTGANGHCYFPLA